MRTGEALRRAVGDLYENSWRFVAANAALGLVLVLVGVLTLMLPLGVCVLPAFLLPRRPPAATGDTDAPSTAAMNH